MLLLLLFCISSKCTPPPPISLAVTGWLLFFRLVQCCIRAHIPLGGSIGGATTFFIKIKIYKAGLNEMSCMRATAKGDAVGKTAIAHNHFFFLFNFYFCNTLFQRSVGFQSKAPL